MSAPGNDSASDDGQEDWRISSPPPPPWAASEADEDPPTTKDGPPRANPGLSAYPPPQPETRVGGLSAAPPGSPNPSGTPYPPSGPNSPDSSNTPGPSGGGGTPSTASGPGTPSGPPAPPAPPWAEQTITDAPGHQPFSPPPQVRQPWEAAPPPPRAPLQRRPPAQEGAHQPFSPPPPVRQPWETGGPDAGPQVPQPAAPPPPLRDEPWLRPDGSKPRRGPGGRKGIIVGAAVALVAVGGAAAFFALNGGGDDDGGDAPASRLADDVFGTGPQASFDSVQQSFDDVRSDGGTAVAVGTEWGGVLPRARFLTSDDGGRSWRTGQVTAQGGGEPSGAAPVRVAGGSGAWLALSGATEHMVTWTSSNGHDWTEHPVAGPAFVKGDVVQEAARTSDGWVAVGYAAPNGPRTPVVWRSPDGAAWERVTALPAGSGGKATELWGVASGGGVVVARGSVTTVQTITKKAKKGKKKKTEKRTVTGDGFWRSQDGGRTWTQVNVPQASGSTGFARGMAFSGGRFQVLRQGSGGGDGILLASQDGTTFSATGRITAPGGAWFNRFTANAQGLVAAAGQGSALLVFHSGNGTAWTTTNLGDARGRSLNAVAPAGTTGEVIVGSVKGADRNFYLATVDDARGPQEADIGRVEGAVNPYRFVGGLSAGNGRLVAVGGTSGDAAAWYSADGGVTWRRAGGDGLDGEGRQTLLDSAAGPGGWFAVGDDAGRPLLATSTDGMTWRRVTDPAFQTNPNLGLKAAAVTSGAHGWVAAGTSTWRGKDSAVVWTSPDGRTWRQSSDGDLHESGNAWRRIADVTASPNGYVAVGTVADPAGQAGQQERPAVWTSADGGQWALQKLPLPAGSLSAVLTRVAVKDSTVVAVGTAARQGASVAFAVRSTDGGRTWSPVDLPGQDGQDDADPTALDVTTTSKGFAVTGTAGRAAAHDVRLWTSRDGATWTTASPTGPGLSGPGAQRVTGLIEQGGHLVATGVSAGSAGESTVLWLPPTP
ncbi:hypothetical protein [Actinomadura atramentaria]|uniref:hypothetical protein n=1 Tax=Actinomadura atramentaria TaxID=1990 RepID=UPI0003A42667|nr:hypothetical protein [Actinomadura atramentaria]